MKYKALETPSSQVNLLLADNKNSLNRAPSSVSIIDAITSSPSGTEPTTPISKDQPRIPVVASSPVIDERLTSLLQVTEIKLTDNIIRLLTNHSNTETLVDALNALQENDISLTPAIIKAIAKHSQPLDFAEILVHLKNEGITITQDIVRAFDCFQQPFSQIQLFANPLIQALINLKKKDIDPTPEIIATVATVFVENRHPNLFVDALVKLNNNGIKLTPEIIVAVAKKQSSVPFQKALIDLNNNKVLDSSMIARLEECENPASAVLFFLRLDPSIQTINNLEKIILHSSILCNGYVITELLDRPADNKISAVEFKQIIGLCLKSNAIQSIKECIRAPQTTELLRAQSLPLFFSMPAKSSTPTHTRRTSMGSCP